MYEMRMSRVMAVIQVVVMVPSVMVVAVTGSWAAMGVMVVVFAVLLWGVFGMKIRVDVGEDAVRFTAPFYGLDVPLERIDRVELLRDNGLNPGLVNWPVVGRTESPAGVRLNLGGSAALRVTVGGGAQKITTVFRDTATAQACARDLEDARGQ